jgi:hypothetical protein
VLLSNEGAVKVSDFGLVKAADNVVQTGSGIPIGKMTTWRPAGGALRRRRARRRLQPRRRGLEMLTMRTLLRRTTYGARASSCGPATRRPSDVDPKVPAAVDDIVMRCLSRDPEQRTPSAQAVSMQLRELLHEIAPGYGRDQLARLASWAFPERKWVIDEPHETAAQPTAAERQSMPQIPAAEAMARVSMAQAPVVPEAMQTVADMQTLEERKEIRGRSAGCSCSRAAGSSR